MKLTILVFVNLFFGVLEGLLCIEIGINSLHYGIAYLVDTLGVIFVALIAGMNLLSGYLLMSHNEAKQKSYIKLSKISIVGTIILLLYGLYDVIFGSASW